MKIGIDIDDVVADFSGKFRNFYNSVFENGNKFKSYDGIRLSEFWGVSEEKVLEILEDFYKSELFLEISPLPGAKNSLGILSNSNDLVAVTNRPTYLREKTLGWVEQHYKGIFKKVLFNGNKHRDYSKSKAQTCLDKGLGVLVDDHASILRDCYDKGVGVILFDQPWNRDAKDLDEFRARDWSHVLDILKKQNEHSRIF